MTSGATGDPAYRRPAHVAYVVDPALGDAAVLLHLPTGRRVTLSSTATAVWLAVVEAGEAGVRAGDLAAPLATRYAADPATVAADVRRLLAQLADEGLVELAESGPATPAGADAG